MINILLLKGIFFFLPYIDLLVFPNFQPFLPFLPVYPLYFQWHLLAIFDVTISWSISLYSNDYSPVPVTLFLLLYEQRFYVVLFASSSQVKGFWPHLSSYLWYRSGLKHLTSEDDLLQFWNGWQKSAYVEHVHFAPLLYISSSHCVTSPLGENCFSYKGTDNHKVFPWNVYANQ